jgi:hypothetical protein
MGVRRLGSVLLVLAVTTAGCGRDDDEGAKTPEPEEEQQAPSRGEDVASPEVSGPVTGGRYGVPFNPMPERLAEEHGYVEEEYFLTGTATSFRPAGPEAWGLDGAWAAEPSEEAPYTTRIVVRRPADAEAFNGTVLVEWLNVTAGMDSDPDFGSLHEVLLREGWAYVGVSAQKVGIAGGAGLTIDIPGFVALPLKEWDPDRYEPLDHPGDAYSYDIFSQVAQALRRPGEVDVLDGLRPTTVLAAGESQSAMRMTTYVNAVHPMADIYDGFLVHSRGNGGAGVTDGDGADPVPPIVHIRSDLDDPVLQFETESDLFLLGFLNARQDDTHSLRTWEVAGTAHADTFTVAYGIESARGWNTAEEPDFTGACGRLNEGPQGPVLRRAIVALRTWVVDGTPPATAPPIEVVDDAVVRDEHGNARGGIRTPAVDVPIATHTGERQNESNIFCSLFGRTTPFDAAKLATLYPTPEDYVTKVEEAADAAVEAGFLLEADAAAMVAAAEENRN